MSRLTRDGTAELASQDQILRGERRQGNIPSGANGDREIFLFPVQLTASKVDSLTWLIHTLLYVMAIRYNLTTTKDERVD